MVLKGIRGGTSVAAIALTAIASLSSKPALAQSTALQPSALQPLPREYDPLGMRIGSWMLYPELDVGLEEDSNIYAEPTNEKDDIILHVAPRVRAELDKGRWHFRGLAQAELRRYGQYQSENSTAGALEADVRFSPREEESFHAGAGLQRVVEDRGDPEANPGLGTGPRRINVLNGELGYHRARGNLLLDLSGSATKLDYVADRDVFRDHTVLTGQATVGRRIGGLAFVTGTAFVTSRSFDRQLDLSGLNRDATTYGARGGIQINPGGLIEGGASVGLFRFEPKDRLIDPYTGISAAANLIYHPTQRTAILLDAFRGNVATFRAGAESRTDTRFRLSVQQEIRHNLFGTATGFIRNTVFRGTGIKERTYGLEGRVSYYFNRHVAAAIVGRYSNRNSDDPFDDFSRFRGLAQLRLYY